MIRLDFPEVAENLPDLEAQLVHFAQSITEAKTIHKKAMDLHEAAEVSLQTSVHTFHGERAGQFLGARWK